MKKTYSVIFDVAFDDYLYHEVEIIRVFTNFGYDKPLVNAIKRDLQWKIAKYRFEYTSKHDGCWIFRDIVYEEVCAIYEAHGYVKETAKQPNRKELPQPINTDDPFQFFNDLGKRLFLQFTITKNTSFEEITRIWKRLIKFLHPDQNQYVDTEITKKLNEAYIKIKKLIR